MRKLKAKITSKLKGSAGESLAEVLIALLIAALALTMLASVISTSARIITQSKAKMKDYYDRNNVLESQSATPDDTKTVVIHPIAVVSGVEGDPDNNVSILLNGSVKADVSLFKNAEAGDIAVYSYKLKEGGS